MLVGTSNPPHEGRSSGGTVLEGFGLGATGHAVGEVCFNTAMTGYEEILTDPSYAGQIITFTFPHIGNVGTNEEDIETVNMAATPGRARRDPAHRDHRPVELARHAPPRPLAEGARHHRPVRHRHARAHRADPRQGHAERRDRARAERRSSTSTALKRRANVAGLVGMDLVPMVTSGQRFTWDETPWEWGKGYGRQDNPEHHVVAIDYGIKRNILRLLAGSGCKVTVVPATTSAEDILALEAGRRVPVQRPGRSGGDRRIRRAGDPRRDRPARRPSASASATRCSASRSAAKTMKMHQGHHGANHPVKDLTTGKVEITSMNHGFAVDQDAAAGERRRDACLAVRRLQLRHRAQGQAGVLGSVSSRGFPWPARQSLSVYAFRRHDAYPQGQIDESRPWPSMQPLSIASRSHQTTDRS